MRCKLLFLLAGLPLLATTCTRDKELLCGDPVIGTYITYEIIDAATGQNWYTIPGRPPIDSLRLLPLSGISGSQYANHDGPRRLGPLAAYSLDPVLNNRQMVTHYLGLGNGDIDTVQLTLHFPPNPPADPCGFPTPADEVAISYNGRPNGVFRASEPADSLSANILNKVVRLQKR